MTWDATKPASNEAKNLFPAQAQGNWAALEDWLNDIGNFPTTPASLKREAVRAHKNGTAQTVNSATWTDVTFGTEAYDVLNSFNGTTFTSVLGGDYMVTAMVAWADAPTDPIRGIRLSLNGTVVAEVYDEAPALAIVVNMTATDTMKVQAVQSSGSAQDIIGTANRTWLSIARL